ncbi:hypothetical protein G6F46_002169 [Rhizopus delemar]|uniref:Afadin-and alpha-actinin-binding protein n=2 Tax=Rhizopus TaxID=4842 RepID=A0A9P6ZD20_9FUNG|nr:hypothetical protein G6F55_005185 [Rhizopus delemar]KAG1552149.1 hypothetical protein G6F51_001399 [Rhizopus arrhizus]KAG1500444.1 hypothetical protein G6F54_003718 [Rhizopus delemar]KAG1517741.1 hypothetical protein G6F53_001140 [Rhizopus delemar]KAG1522749.1 hypothetical protein G6F52_005596 [Rhizopus delemar]
MNNSLSFSYDIVENFCTPDSLDASVNYINLLLTSYGYPVPVVVNSSEPEDHCKTINCIYALINDRKKDMQERQRLLEKIDQLHKDQEELRTSLVNHKREYTLQDKKIIELSSKLESSEKECKRQQTHNTRLKEEVTKAKNNMQYMKTQYMHETKRHEQDMSKVQERLLKLMNSHLKTNIASLDMNSHFATTTDYAADNDEVIQVRSMYTDLLLKSTDREREAKKESEDLRIALVQLYTGVRRLMEDRIKQFDQHSRKKSYKETARFNLPMDCGAKEALKEVENLLARLKEEWDYQISNISNEESEEQLQEKDKLIQSLESTMEDLLQNIETMKIEYDGKIQVYEKYEKGGFFDTIIPEPQPVELSDSESSVTDFQLGNVSKYKSLRKKAMRERRKITEAAEELGKQRAQLNAELWAIKEMKYELQKREILEEHSPSPSSIIHIEQPSHTEPQRTYKRFRPSSLGAPSGR